MNDRQCEVLATLIDNPGAKIDGRSLPSLRKLGYLDAEDRPKMSAWHALGRWKNVPRLSLPSDDLIAFFAGKSILVTERRNCDCPSCYGSHDEATFEVDAQRVMRFTRAVREFGNELIAKAWSRDWDSLVEYCSGDPRVKSNVSLLMQDYQRRAESSISEERAGIDLRYTSHLVIDMGLALMDQPTRHSLPSKSTGQKSSFSDTDWEAEALRPEQGATPVASLEISLH